MRALRVAGSSALSESLLHPVYLGGQLICYLTGPIVQEPTRSGFILTWRVLPLKPAVE